MVNKELAGGVNNVVELPRLQYESAYISVGSCAQRGTMAAAVPGQYLCPDISESGDSVCE